ncbi:hypothetical protein [Streptomyces sp. NPDC086777]
MNRQPAINAMDATARGGATVPAARALTTTTDAGKLPMGPVTP